jgi:hypothetical protein
VVHAPKKPHPNPSPKERELEDCSEDKSENFTKKMLTIFTNCKHLTKS